LRQAGRDVDFNEDVVGINPDNGGGGDGGQHAVPWDAARPWASS
jgi:hypothetical protein